MRPTCDQCEDFDTCALGDSCPVKDEPPAKTPTRLMPQSLIDTAPPLYATEKVRAEDKTIHAVYRCGTSYWMLAELDSTDRLAFGFCYLHGGSPEWGYFSIDELESIDFEQEREVRTPEGALILTHVHRVQVELDPYFTPTVFSQIHH